MGFAVVMSLLLLKSIGSISMHLNVLCMGVWRMLHTEEVCLYHFQHIQHLQPVDMGSWLEFCHWINASPPMIHNILFANKAHFTCDGVSNTRQSYLWNRDNPHGTVKINHQHCFSVNV
jgi:hypothetical protein